MTEQLLSAAGARTVPAHALPAAVADWVDHIQQARQQGGLLSIAGGHTKAFLGEPLPSRATILHTRSHTGVVSYEPSELVVTARGGTPLAELEATLAAHGQALAFEPLHGGTGATVGGAVAAGLSGPSRASVGAVRDFVLGVHVVNGRGEYLVMGGQVMKNVAGYDVSRLMAGSMGTLGVLAEVSLKVLPVAPAEATLSFDLPQAPALAQLRVWGGQPLPLNASRWVSGAPTGASDRLYVRLRGAVAAVEAACVRMLSDVSGTRLEPAQAQPEWALCREQGLPFFVSPSDDLCVWRLSVPQSAPALLDAWPQLVEWHGAQRWLWAPAQSADEIRRATQRVGGHATLWRVGPLAHDAAVGVPRFEPLAPVTHTLNQRMRLAFDPDGIFFPGRMG